MAPCSVDGDERGGVGLKITARCPTARADTRTRGNGLSTPMCGGLGLNQVNTTTQEAGYPVKSLSSLGSCWGRGGCPEAKHFGELEEKCNGYSLTFLPMSMLS